MHMKRWLWRVGLAAPLSSAMVVAACGGGDANGIDPATGADASSADGEPPTFDPDSGTFGRDTGLPPGCATQTERAKQQPVDIYMMIDTSGSMTERTATGPTAPTKWDAVRTAITSFVNDSKSNGIGVGVQYFPIIVPNTQAQSCAND